MTLKENGGLPAGLLWTLAVMAGVTVANLYYNQPLLGMMRADFGITDFQANMVAMFSQAGYALGLFFIIPLGDMFRRKRIIEVNFVLLVMSLLTISLASDFRVMLAASLVTGVCSVVPQIFIPIAAQFSTPQTKGRNVGIVLSGLLTGILASRVVSGLVGDLWGWRAMYGIAAVLMVCGAVITMRVLPDIAPTFRGRYAALMKSMFSLVREFPQLRVYAGRAGLAFGSFLSLWACLAFRMAQEPYCAGSDVVGLLGLCGVCGALSASFIGRYVKRFGVKRFNYLGCALMLAAWSSLFWAQDSYAGLIAGIILIDIGMQCIQLSNQTSMFDVSPGAANRVNTIFMTTYFVGGSLGTLLAGAAWSLGEWSGVVCVGVFLSLLSLTLTVFTKY